MFWKHRKIRLLLLCAASAVLLSISYTGYLQTVMTPTESTSTVPNSTTYFVTEPDITQATIPINALGAPSKGTIPTGYRNTEPTGYSKTEPSQVVESRIVKKRSLEPFLQTLCVISGIVFAGIYCFTRQKNPVFGPDGDTFGCMISIRTLKDWMNFYPGMQTRILTVFVIMLLLTSVRGLVWWLLNRLPLFWSLTERTAVYVRKSAGNQGYLITHLLVCVTQGICMILFLAYDQLHNFFGVIPFGISILMCILCIWKHGKQTEHLQQQIDNLYQSKEIIITDGTFAQQETQLAGLQTRINEAVTTAVTGERFKVELISNVSHDLRTPLTAILGYGELLENETLSEQGQQHLQKLNQKAAYMRDLVDSVFELTKVSSGAVPPNMENIDLIRLLEQTLGLFDDELNAQALQIRRHYCTESLYLTTDGNRLHQVFANLVGNAIKYALPGSRVHLYVTEGAGQIVVRMTNIAAYEMDFHPEEIIQRFVRGDKARASKGSGIGLAIAQTYTQSVGGSFRVEIDGEQFTAIAELPKDEREL